MIKYERLCQAWANRGDKATYPEAMMGSEKAMDYLGKSEILTHHLFGQRGGEKIQLVESLKDHTIWIQALEALLQTG